MPVWKLDLGSKVILDLKQNAREKLRHWIPVFHERKENSSGAYKGGNVPSPIPSPLGSAPAARSLAPAPRHSPLPASFSASGRVTAAHRHPHWLAVYPTGGDRPHRSQLTRGPWSVPTESPRRLHQHCLSPPPVAAACAALNCHRVPGRFRLSRSSP